jgi:plastocyanin
MMPVRTFERMKSTLVFLMLLPAVFFGQTTVDLYIIEGVVTNGNYDVPYFTFNTREQFDSSNVVLRFSPGEEVTFHITNRTDFSCGFNVEAHGGIDRIAMNETKEVTITFDQEGVYLYQDPTNDHRALGLGGWWL